MDLNPKDERVISVSLFGEREIKRFLHHSSPISLSVCVCRFLKVSAEARKLTPESNASQKPSNSYLVDPQALETQPHALCDLFPRPAPRRGRDLGVHDSPFLKVRLA